VVLPDELHLSARPSGISKLQVQSHAGIPDIKSDRTSSGIFIDWEMCAYGQGRNPIVCTV
jgi:hypothetical protein